MVRPRILIPTPTSFDPAYNQQCWPEYANAVREAGGEPVPVQLSHTAAELESMAAAAGGIVLPGSGADVSPARYGHPRSPASADADPLREATDWALLDAASQAGTPLLGICMGLQFLNVFHGGTLLQDVEPVPVNHRAGRNVNKAHTVTIESDSLLHRLVVGTGELLHEEGSQPRLPVNSSHHQAIHMAGDGLRVVARCPQDGVIEAVEAIDGRWLIGVQWHPERTTASSEASCELFRQLVQAARH